MDHTDLQLLTRAHGTFLLLVAAIDHEQLTSPTPCDGWSVADLVDHVVAGSFMATALVAGDSSEHAQAVRADRMQGFPSLDIARIAAQLLAERRAFASTDPELVVDHPVLPMPARSLLEQRLVEYSAHGWDLRQATGVDVLTDDTVLAAAVAAMTPLAPLLGQLGMFGQGPSEHGPGERSLEDQLVDMVGRRT